MIGVVSSLIYYFARYYVKTDHEDKELLTKKPVDWKSVGDNRTEAAERSAIEKSQPVSGEQALQLRTSPVKPIARKTLSEALANTRGGFWGRISQLSFGGDKLNSEVRDQLEEILYTSDMGPHVAELLLSQLSENFSQCHPGQIDGVKNYLREMMLTFFADSEKSQPLFNSVTSATKKPVVWVVVGINGAGKTTTIGKLASLAKTKNLKTLIVAGDTFRAAADSQLKVWAERAGCEIFHADNTKDPGAVAYAGVERARATGVDLVIVDTAGRLHTQAHLMEELKKIVRVIQKLDASAPHETLLVIDANAGQNALAQAEHFNQAVPLSRVIVTKMDGSSKAGVVVGIAHDLHLPIAYVGLGEAVEDLREFDAKAFVEAIV